MSAAHSRSWRRLALLFTVGLVALRGEEPPPIRAEVSYVSSHVFQGVERTGAAAQTVLEFNRESWRGGLWSSLPLAGGPGREVNLNTAYAWAAMDGLSLEASAAHTWFDGVVGVDRSLQAGLAARLDPIQGFTPSLAYDHDFRFHADAVQLALARSIPLTSLGAFLELNLYSGWCGGSDWRPDASGPRRRDAYRFWGAEAQLPYRVGPSSTVIAAIHYAGNSGRSLADGAFGRASRDKCWVSLGVSLDF